MTKRIMTPEELTAHNMRVRANRIKRAALEPIWENNARIKAIGDKVIAGFKVVNQSKFVIPLPFPPSANHYWRHVGGRTMLSASALAYRKTVKASVGPMKYLEGELKVSLDYWYPDKRRRDIDNLAKQLLDSLVMANVMKDDSQIVDLHLRKLGYEKGGSVLVTIEKA